MCRILQTSLTTEPILYRWSTATHIPENVFWGNTSIEKKNKQRKNTQQNVSKWLTLGEGCECIKDFLFSDLYSSPFPKFPARSVSNSLLYNQGKKYTWKRTASHIHSYYCFWCDSSANGRHIFCPFLLPPGEEALKEIFDTEIKMRISLEQVISSRTLFQY